MAYSEMIGDAPLELSGPATLNVLRVTLEPGGNTGWHWHSGLELVAVESGTLTRYFAPDYLPVENGPGEFFSQESGPRKVHIGRNLGDDPVVVLQILITPANADPTTRVPAPYL